jgi:dihydroneopterin aldolase
MADKILIRDLILHCIIGTNDDERIYKQDVCLNLVIETDLAAPGASDDLADTLDYRSLKNEISEHLDQSSYFLIERMAAAVADICLAKAMVQAVTVTVDKPGALTKTRSVAVEIHRRALP